MRKFERNAILIVAEITLTLKFLLLVIFCILGASASRSSGIQNYFFSDSK